MLAYHSVGVGKTLTGISVAENFKSSHNIFILVKNKSLELNFRRELLGTCSNYITPEIRAQLTSKKVSPSQKEYILYMANREINKNYSFLTYGTVVNSVLGRKNEQGNRIVKNKISSFNNSLIIIDEVHNVTGNDAYIAIKKIMDNSKNTRILLLSATPIFDSIKEIFEIANLLGDSLPTRGKLISSGLVKKVNAGGASLLNEVVFSLTSKGKQALSQSFRGKISYLVTDPEYFPKRIDKGQPISDLKGSINIYRCAMNQFQDSVYASTLDGDSVNTLFKDSSDASTIVYPNGKFGKNGFKYIKKDKTFLQYKNIKKYSSKFFYMFGHLLKAKGPCFIYSNYVTGGGTQLIKQFLLENGYAGTGSYS
jgi:hypothetical protein